MEVTPDRTTRLNYKVQQKILAARPVYEIFDETTGQQIGVARQTWLSFLRSTMHMEDMQGNRILTARGGFFDKTFWLEDQDGNRLVRLTRPWIALRKNFKMYYRDEEVKAQGGLLAWGFEALSSGGIFAFRFDKKILAIRDQFRVQVGDYMDWKHAVASALVVDRIFFKGSSCMCRLICCFGIIGILFAFVILSALF
ncbi:MAG: hypothetical protein E3J86_09885 [Candidatus Thorarchaeota archaeon]|nr:MAG: hypothetical protein E3J86_09885 [Candidatus Thorarchaeota archaeon]